MFSARLAQLLDLRDMPPKELALFVEHPAQHAPTNSADVPAADPDQIILEIRRQVPGWGLTCFLIARIMSTGVCIACSPNLVTAGVCPHAGGSSCIAGHGHVLLTMFRCLSLVPQIRLHHRSGPRPW